MIILKCNLEIWTDIIQDGDQWKAIVSTVMNLKVQ
jgi:hypothetical protein